MRSIVGLMFVGLLGLSILPGCSEKTQQETKEALKAAGEDTKENAAKVAGAVEDAAQAAQEKLDGDDEPEEPAPAAPTAPVAPEPKE